jgi:tRNA pseudouridine38-40 synthase
MNCYKLTIAYDGTRYSGWQIQPNALTIQQIIQDRLKILLHEPEVVIIASGRTDAGVHAHGQVAHFRTRQSLDVKRFLLSLNGMLPADIRIKKIEEVHSTFHAQYHVTRKEYHYYLYLERVMNPFQRLYCWHVYNLLDFALLLEATSYFKGTHDFTSFANEAHVGTASRDPIRTLYRVDPVLIAGGIRIEFEGDGFLYKMVRNIVGTLVEVASQKRPLKCLKELFEVKDRKQAGRAAPPKGLFLMRVDYPENMNSAFKEDLYL